MEGIGSIILFIVLIAISFAAKKEQKGGSSAKTPPKADTPKTEKPKRPQMPKHPGHPYAPSKPKEKRTFTPEAQERRYYDSDCEAMMTKHDHDRRMEQLDDFLKSGLIGREEYHILKERYSR